MVSQARYRLNSPTVILETFEDEVVIVNLESGTYYSLGTTGAAICGAVERGTTSSEIEADLAAHFEGDRDAMAQAASIFLCELEREGIVLVTIEAGESVAATPTSLAASPTPSAMRPFETPTLQKYTDMQELLLLDPIHEVDDAGWPKTKS
jgi:hypothetical protein